MRPSIIQSTTHQWLLSFIIFNLVSTAFHYTDNAIFVSQYPEPTWFTTAGVFAAWFVMTPFALLGYWLYTQGKHWIAYSCLGFYSITSLSSPVHYLYPLAEQMTLKMHGLIWLDAIAGLTLVGWLIYSIRLETKAML
ncbi:hypothetical protein IFO70_04810 [Phormidium tenue FACHB-886]|nr:hypothetical protein [Phormidium tenue FACHB-886]